MRGFSCHCLIVHRMPDAAGRAGARRWNFWGLTHKCLRSAQVTAQLSTGLADLKLVELSVIIQVAPRVWCDDELLQRNYAHRVQHTSSGEKERVPSLDASSMMSAGGRPRSSGTASSHRACSHLRLCIACRRANARVLLGACYQCTSVAAHNSVC